MRYRKRAVLMVVLLLTVVIAQVSTNNQCGNEQRNWQTLTFPKGDYCSIPAWLPLNPWYENANKAVCKVHDNNSGIYGTISQSEADLRFLCDYVKRSELLWGVRHLTGLLSYLALRGAAVFNAL